MYRIYANKSTLHHPNRFPDNYIVADPTMTEEINAHGSLTFSVPPDNPMYNSLRRLKTIVEVFDDDGPVWRGRVVSDTQTTKRLKKVYCEGELSFFCDSVVRPYVHRGSVAALFTYLVNNHNAQVDPTRQFEVGDITVEDANEYIVRSSSAPMNTWDALKSWLVDKLGGYLVTRREGVQIYIDYLAQMPTRATQKIEWGKNIIDISEAISAENVITCLIPYGAQIEPGASGYEDPPQSGQWNGDRLTIASVNGGLDYIENADGVDAFGRVWGSYVWEDVTVASNLKTKAQAFLQEQIRAACTVTVSAVDLHMVNRDVPALRIGDEVPVKSSRHGINTTLICRKRVVPLMDLSKARITLGAGTAEITSMQSSGSSVGTTIYGGGADIYERVSNKLTAWRANPDNDHYPSEALVRGSIDYLGANWVRNPVLIYDKTGKLHVAGTIKSGTDSANGLLNQGQGEGTSRDITSWNIEGLDLSQFRALRVVCRRNSANYGCNCEFYIPLDGDPTPTRNIYVSGATVSTYGDRNRLQIIVCAVDAAKSKFCVTQTLTLYGTAVTVSSDMFVERIYGCYR